MKQKRRQWSVVLLVFTIGLAVCCGMFFFIFSSQQSEKSLLFRLSEVEKELPDKVVITRSASENVTSLEVSNTDKAVVEQLYTELDGFEFVETNRPMHCPAMQTESVPREYTIIFYKDGSVLDQIIFTPPGCRGTVRRGDVKTLYGVTDKSINFQQRVQTILNISSTDFRGY